MQGFSSPQLVTGTTDGLNVVITQPFSFVCEDGWVINVPVGVRADGASVPRFFWRIFPPFGRYWMAAILHDFLYNYSDWTKHECDLTFLEAMKASGVGRITRETLYCGVRYGGLMAFRGCRKRQKEILCLMRA